MENQMFCYQCQETAGCKGCTRIGVCGKTPQVAAMQDLLVYVSKGISAVTTQLRKEGKSVSADVNQMVTLNLFITITNANFDEDMIVARILDTLRCKEELLAQVADKDALPAAAFWYAEEKAALDEKARQVGVLSTHDEDIRSLRELITYGLKGLSAYSKHANALLQKDEEVDAFLQKALAATLDDSLTVADLVALTMEVGKYGVSGMELLDRANTSSYGNPEMTKVNIGVGKRPGILVSGHDLRDLEMLLEQSKDFTRKIEMTQIAEGGVGLETRVTDIDGVPVMEVIDDERFYDKFNWLPENGGFEAATGAHKINVLIACGQTCKTVPKINSIYFFAPGAHTEGDGYLYQNRNLSDTFVFPNGKDGKIDSVYVDVDTVAVA